MAEDNNLRPAAPAAPTKIGKEIDRRQKNTNFLIGCFGAFIAVFVLFVVLMVLVISRGGADNAVMRAFGVDPSRVQDFLLMIISLSFGSLSFLFFILMVIGLFRVVGAKKGDTESKKGGLRMAFFSFIPFVLVLLVWLGLFNFLGQLQITSERVSAEIIMITPEESDEYTAPIEITFSSLNVVKALEASDFTISSLAWDLDGDGNFETPGNRTPEITRLYNRKGIVNVGLQVQVQNEAQPRIYNKIINISTAVFGAQPAVGVAPLAVAFDAGNLVEGSARLNQVDWDFDGNGTYDSRGDKDNLQVKHTYEQIGKYDAHLRIVDENNNVENYYRTIEVVKSDEPLLVSTIDISPGISGDIPFRVRLDGSNSRGLKGTIVKYEWDLGDGSDIQNGKTISYTYNTPGFYKVKLTIADESGLTASSILEVQAKALTHAPVAVIKTSPALLKDAQELKGDLPFKVEFDAVASTDPDNDIVDYGWDFDGDGKADQTGQKVTYTFDQEGTYETSLTVTDATGLSNKAVIKVVVTAAAAKSVIQAKPEEGVAPLIVEFDGSGSSAFQDKIVSYEWDFGDGSPKTITGANVNHKYALVGSYTVKLRVVTSKNLSAESSKLIYVREIPLRACFEPSRSSGPAPLSVSFDPKCSTGTIKSYRWNFGDDLESDNRKPSHTFEKPGTYTVTLEVADDKNNVNVFTDVISAEGALQ